MGEAKWVKGECTASVTAQPLLIRAPAGTLVIGLHPAGQIVGYAAIVWGIVAMAVHVWLRVYIGKATAVNVPLANFWRNRDSHASSDKASSTSSVQVQWPPAVPAAASARL